MRTPSVLLGCLLLVLGTAAADDDPKTKKLTAGESVDAVLSAVRGEDADALKTLAEVNKPDPWMVAELLCYDGEHDAAEAFAKAAPRPQTEALPAYVASRRGVDRDELAYGVISQMKGPEKQWDSEAVLARTSRVTGPLDTVFRIEVRIVRGIALIGLLRHEESMDTLRVAASAARELGMIARARVVYFQITMSSIQRRDLDAAIESATAELEIALMCDNPAAALGAYNSIGVAQKELGRYPEALEAFAAAAELVSESPAHQGDKITAVILNNLGLLEKDMGRFTEARDHLLEALAIVRRSEGPSRIAGALSNVGGAHYELGEFREAIRCYEEAIRVRGPDLSRAEVARDLGHLALVEVALGDVADARAYFEQVLEIKRELGDRKGEGNALTAIATLEAETDPEAALARLLEVRAIWREVGNKHDLAGLLLNIAGCEELLGRHEAAAEYEAEAARLAEELGNGALAAMAFHNLGVTRRRLEDLDGAHAAYERAYRLLEAAPHAPTLARVLSGMAEIELDRGNAAASVALCQRVVRLLAGVTTGLAEGEGATARDEHWAAFDIGYRAAAAARDVDALLGFLEEARAGSLRESLGSRAALEAVVVPDDLRKELDLARDAERRSLDAYHEARRQGRRKTTRKARIRWERDHKELERVQNRIQREAKHTAAVTHVAADDMAAVQGRLEPGDVLVHYALTSRRGLALVITSDTARIVSLAEAPDLDAAIGALLDVPERVDPEKVPALRALFVDPLELPGGTRRVLLSPMGRLGYVPFALLLGDVELAYVPSGTTYGLLCAQRDARGEGVLGLGDPDYVTVVDETALEVHRGAVADRLPPLPGTRDEVKAIADVAILGKDATESGLRTALKQRDRWRSVHLACHGLVDPERPMRSALAVTADERDDGFLRAMEVLRADVPSDLVVLSACDTGKGRIYKTEGLLGLTSAFMHAGTPRVIASLWKVDDAATMALMTKFYEVWNPEDAEVSVAKALRKAQEHVRATEGWAHPKYWAAWVLWGLPD